MQSDTIEFFSQALVQMRPGLRGRDPEWQELERLQRELEAQVRGACGGEGPLLSLLLTWRTPGPARRRALTRRASCWGCRWGSIWAGSIFCGRSKI